MRVATIQMVSVSDPQINMERARFLLEQAKEQSAQLAVLPEYWPIMGKHDTDKVVCAEKYGDGPLQAFLSSCAKELGMTIVAGTIPLISDEINKIWNATLVFDSAGECIARYNKVHLFGFNNGDESYQESNTITAGGEVGSFESEIGTIGIGICYDVRFPELFRAMGTCSLIILPAAFTYTTGQAHWEVLLRARAIENQCFVLASAQGGTHDNGRRTWGHSMVIDPWGAVLTCIDEGEGVAVVELDLANMQKIRDNLPALKHRKLAC